MTDPAPAVSAEHALSSANASAYCDQCGEPAGAGEHGRCAVRRELEPPRYCPECRRRMVVQVVPRGWTAKCSEHGLVATQAATAVS